MINIKALEKFIFENNHMTDVIKDKLITNSKNRLCHHKVRFLNLLVSFMEGKIRNYLEIGVHNGCSMSYIVHNSNKLDNVVGIDLFEDTFYKDKLILEDIKKFINKNNTSNSKIHLIKGNSKDINTINKAKKISEKYDLIFIDGDHSYDGVKNDFNMVYNLLSENGILVFDDFNKNPIQRGVYKFVNELLNNQSKYFNGYYKFIDNTHTSNKYNDGIILFYK